MQTELIRVTLTIEKEHNDFLDLMSILTGLRKSEIARDLLDDCIAANWDLVKDFMKR